MIRPRRAGGSPRGSPPDSLYLATPGAVFILMDRTPPGLGLNSDDEHPDETSEDTQPDDTSGDTRPDGETAANLESGLPAPDSIPPADGLGDEETDPSTIAAAHHQSPVTEADRRWASNIVTEVADRTDALAYALLVDLAAGREVRNWGPEEFGPRTALSLARVDARHLCARRQKTPRSARRHAGTIVTRMTDHFQASILYVSPSAPLLLTLFVDHTTNLQLLRRTLYDHIDPNS